MIDIKFEIGGKKVSPNKFGDALEAAVLSQITEHLKKSVGSIRCKEHNQSPTLKVKGRNIDNLSYEVHGCCDALIEQVSEKLQ